MSKSVSSRKTTDSTDKIQFFKQKLKLWKTRILYRTNQRPFGSQPGTQSTQPHHPGKDFFHISSGDLKSVNFQYIIIWKILSQ